MNCCFRMKDELESDEKTGFYIRLTDEGFYKLYHRSVADEDVKNLPVMPIKIVLDSAIKISFCPWCGTKLVSASIGEINNE
jgi:hypothetical protein